jgi:hypothetical protein
MRGNFFQRVKNNSPKHFMLLGCQGYLILLAHVSRNLVIYCDEIYSNVAHAFTYPLVCIDINSSVVILLYP